MALSVRGLAGASIGALGALNGYWGQKSNHALRAYCDGGISSITLGFINSAPEHDPSTLEYPGINFSSHCWAEAFTDANHVASPLYSHCQSLKTDIPYCQSKGVKVILSIGGMYSFKNNYRVSSTTKGEQFAEKVYQIFGPYNPAANVARPFDSDNQHVAVDGFDFDLEIDLDNKPYIAMINKLRTLDKSLIITAAPQCPLSTTPNDMMDILKETSLDALFIQFYNNPVCDYVTDGKGDKFNLDEWVTFMAKSRKSQTAKLYVGLPGGPTSDSATSGYITPDQVKDLVCKYSTRTPHWGGISIWDLDTAAANIIGGKDYSQHVAEALKYGCGPVPTTTSTTVSSTKTSSSSTTKSSSTTTSSTTKASSTTSSLTSSTSVSSISKASSTTASSSTTPSSTTSSTSKLISTASSISVASSTTVRSATESSSSSTKASSSSSTKATSSTAKATSVITADVTTSPSVPTSTPVTSIVSSATKWSNSTITSGTVSMTTSTVYTTSVHTVTKCLPYVTNCPTGGYVTTETIPLYTTVCPITETPKLPKPSQTKTSAAWTTSTVYTTKVHTATACPPQVTNCLGRVTTETIPWYTTICPVTETERGKVPQRTPSVPGGVNPPPVESTSTTSTITETVTISANQTTGVTPKPSCSGPGCPGVSSGVALPTLSWATTAVPLSTPGGLSAVPSNPVQAGASTLAISLSGLIAMVAFQVFAL
ncbi:chitinase 18-18 [Purpureocillium lilacinum]|uniref:chitinase n=1 Tax=Purpureocillium lilacinum TaxID=33203 RepID=A0A179F0Z4_PURLI|nr:chitinase 18-18 [Purpureocillium lilacinum]OAQ59078.1 chitinase 18-18 [Purpureocillium lilacinum]